MVDTNVLTSTSSPLDLYKFEDIKYLFNFVDAWESYSKQGALGIQVDQNIIKARLQSLFIVNQSHLKRRLDSKVFDDIKLKLFQSLPLHDDEILKIFFTMQDRLDADLIIKMDNRKSYDGTRVEKENENFQL